jgi:hypothetical protein
MHCSLNRIFDALELSNIAGYNLELLHLSHANRGLDASSKSASQPFPLLSRPQRLPTANIRHCGRHDGHKLDIS